MNKSTKKNIIPDFLENFLKMESRTYAITMVAKNTKIGINLAGARTM